MKLFASLAAWYRGILAPPAPAASPPAGGAPALQSPTPGLPPLTAEIFDERTERILATLIPRVVPDFRRLLSVAGGIAAAHGCVVKAISGTRTYAEQDALYRQAKDGIDNDKDGRTDEADERVTKARAGESNHNFGIAIDLGVFGRDGAYLDNANPSLAEKVHRAIAAEVKRRPFGRDMEWGGDWKSIVDLPHWQYRTGRTMDELRANVRRNNGVLKL